MTIPLYDLTDTWNDSGTVFTGLKFNVTNTASGTASRAFDFQIGGASFFYSDTTDGSVTVRQIATAVTGATFRVLSKNAGTTNFSADSGDSGGINVRGPIAFQLGTAGEYINFAGNTRIVSPGANILEVQQSTNAQTLRVYNTFTDSSNYERAVFDWTTTSNVLTIGTEALGTGSVRNVFLTSRGPILNFGIAGISYMQFNSSGAFALAAGGQNAFIGFSSSTTFSLGIQGTLDTSIARTAAGVLAFGNGTAGDSSACILAKTKAGAFTTSDVPASTWVVGRDTSGATTKVYYNNAGTLMSVALT